MVKPGNYPAWIDLGFHEWALGLKAGALEHKTERKKAVTKKPKPKNIQSKYQLMIAIESVTNTE